MIKGVISPPPSVPACLSGNVDADIHTLMSSTFFCQLTCEETLQLCRKGRDGTDGTDADELGLQRHPRPLLLFWTLTSGAPHVPDYAAQHALSLCTVGTSKRKFSHSTRAASLKSLKTCTWVCVNVEGNELIPNRSRSGSSRVWEWKVDRLKSIDGNVRSGTVMIRRAQTRRRKLWMTSVNIYLSIKLSLESVTCRKGWKRFERFLNPSIKCECWWKVQYIQFTRMFNSENAANVCYFCSNKKGHKQRL